MGLAGKPEHPEAFVRFTVDHVGSSGETDVYLARETWEGMHGDGNHRPGTDRLEVLLPGYGRFWLRFECPASD